MLNRHLRPVKSLMRHIFWATTLMDPFAPKRSRVTHEDAEKLAIDALSFLAGDPGLLAQFAAATGHTPATIRAEIASPEFLAGILDFLMNDESLLLVFASHQGITPPDIIAARQMLAPDVAAWD
jgi:hypothetical protein